MPRYREWDLACKVYVGNLGSSASKYEIEKLFSKYGSLRNVWVARNPPGFAFVEFEERRDAEDATRALDGTRCGGDRIRVEMSSGRSRRDDRRGGGGRGGGGGGSSGGRGGRYRINSTTTTSTSISYSFSFNKNYNNYIFTYHNYSFYSTSPTTIAKSNFNFNLESYNNNNQCNIKNKHKKLVFSELIKENDHKQYIDIISYKKIIMITIYMINKNFTIPASLTITNAVAPILPSRSQKLLLLLLQQQQLLLLLLLILLLPTQVPQQYQHHHLSQQSPPQPLLQHIRSIKMVVVVCQCRRHNILYI